MRGDCRRVMGCNEGVRCTFCPVRASGREQKAGKLKREEKTKNDCSFCLFLASRFHDTPALSRRIRVDHNKLSTVRLHKILHSSLQPYSTRLFSFSRHRRRRLQILLLYHRNLPPSSLSLLPLLLLLLQSLLSLTFWQEQFLHPKLPRPLRQFQLLPRFKAVDGESEMGE